MLGATPASASTSVVSKDPRANGGKCGVEEAPLGEFGAVVDEPNVSERRHGEKSSCFLGEEHGDELEEVSWINPVFHAS